MIDLSARHEGEEIMDNYSGDPFELQKVFEDINHVNKILGGNKITIDAVFRLIAENPKESYTILDMGCGDGNMIRAIAREARNRNIDMKLIGVDLNQEALTIAGKASVNFPEISYQKKDILTANFSDFKSDIVITTLTMHHFRNEDVLRFVRQFTKLASLGVIVNDLQRSAWAYYLFQGFRLIFIRTKIAKIDGLISISKGFKKADLEALAKKIPDVVHDIKWKWAFRYVWIMRKRRPTVL